VQCKNVELQPAWRLTVIAGPFFSASHPISRTTEQERVQVFMPDTRVYFASGAAQLAKEGDAAREHQVLRDDNISKTAEPTEESQHFASSPSGTRLNIPKELFVALSDFIKTRKCPGSITIQFRRGEIICVEAVAKKTYRNS
jgi:hypothetical protein